MTAQSSKNVSSKILSAEENKSIFNLLASKRCSTLATTVVQVQLAYPNSRAWTKKCTGVLCLVKDSSMRSYFLRVFNIKDRALLWEQEIYNSFVYNRTLDYFHTFQAHDCTAGFNFANVEEAKQFYTALTDKLRSRKERKENKQQQIQKNASPSTPLPPQNNRKSSKPTIENFSSKSSKEKSSKKKDSKSSKRITKLDISGPSDFRHLEHLGFDKQTGAFVSEVSNEWKDLFSTIGLTGSQLQDEATLKAVQRVVEEHGGIERATQEIKSIQGRTSARIVEEHGSIEKRTPDIPPKKTPQSIPSRPVRPPPRPTSGTRPPPAVPLPGSGHHTSRPAPAKVPPPLPPPSTRRPSFPSGQSGPSPVTNPPQSPFSTPSAIPPTPQPSISSSVPTPPPPPPPPPSAPGPPSPPASGVPPPPAPPLPQTISNDASAVKSQASTGPASFLDQIQSGVSLRKAENVDTGKSKAQSSRMSDNLLDSIREGISLKRVEVGEREPAPAAPETGILGALHKELAKINNRVTASDSEESDGSSGDEWD